MAGPEENTKPS